MPERGTARAERHSWSPMRRGVDDGGRGVFQRPAVHDAGKGYVFNKMAFIGQVTSTVTYCEVTDI